MVEHFLMVELYQTDTIGWRVADMGDGHLGYPRDYEDQRECVTTVAGAGWGRSGVRASPRVGGSTQEAYLGGWRPERGRRRARELFADSALTPTRTVHVIPELCAGSSAGAGRRSRSCSGANGRLHHVGELMAGSIHDVAAFREAVWSTSWPNTCNNLVIADLTISANPSSPW